MLTFAHILIAAPHTHLSLLLTSLKVSRFCHYRTKEDASEFSAMLYGSQYSGTEVSLSLCPFVQMRNLTSYIEGGT